MEDRKGSDDKRFLSKFDKTENCWIWKGLTYSNGYPHFRTFRDGKAKSETATRYSWRLFRGEIPEGMYLLHKCDNPLCVNPDHLFLGSQKDNIQDMVNKGRNHGKALRGEDHPRAKLTMEQATEIRRLYSETHLGLAKIGSMFGVSKHSISLIVKNKSYKATV